jgi:hypothetical protein
MKSLDKETLSFYTNINVEKLVKYLIKPNNLQTAVAWLFIWSSPAPHL